MTSINFTTSLNGKIQTTLVSKLAKKLKVATTATAYEVISTSDTSHTKPYFDIDYKEVDHAKDFKQVYETKAESILKPGTDFICKHFKCNYDDLAISESIYDNKISYHIIVATMKILHPELVNFKNTHKDTFKKLNIDPAVYGRGVQKIQKFRLIHTTKEEGVVLKPSPLIMVNKCDVKNHFISYTDNLPIFKLPKQEIQIQQQPKIKQAVKTPLVVKTVQVKATKDVNPIVDNIKFILEHLTPETIYDTEKWISIVFGIYNEMHDNKISLEITRQIIHQFSKRSENEVGISNYKASKVDAYITGLTPGTNKKCGIGTLLFYLKQDNLEKFNEYQKKDNSYDDQTYEKIKERFEETHFKIRKPLLFYEVLEGDTYGYSTIDFKQLNAELFYYVFDKDKNEYKKKDFINTWLKDGDKREYNNLDFYPNISKCPKTIYNTFKDFKVNNNKYTDEELEDVDISPILDHIKMVLVNGDAAGYEYVLKWCANIFQKPDELSRVALIFKSKEGVGKGIFMDLLSEIIGESYSKSITGAKNVFGAFNGIAENQLLINLNEASGGDTYDFVEDLKTSITDKCVRVQKKYQDTRVVNNYARYIIFTNNQNCIKISENDRRYVGFQCSDPKTAEYYDVLTDAIKSDKAQYKFYKYLCAIDITDYNFAKNMPKTEFYNDMKLMNASKELLFVKHIYDSKDRKDTYKGGNLFELFKHYLINNNYLKYDKNAVKFGITIKDIPGVTKKLSNGIKYKFNYEVIKTYLQTVGMVQTCAFNDSDSDDDSDTDDDQYYSEDSC